MEKLELRIEADFIKIMRNNQGICALIVGTNTEAHRYKYRKISLFFRKDNVVNIDFIKVK